MKLSPRFGLLLLAILAITLSTVSTAVALTVAGKGYTPIVTAAGKVGMRVKRFGTSKIEVTGKRDKMTLFPDKRYVFLNGVRLHLNYAPLVRGGTSYLSEFDDKFTFNPLLGNRSRYRHPIGVIVIDPGHGGKDQGASGKFLREKTLTLRLARLVQQKLQACGYQVVLTRTGDTYPSLEQRNVTAVRRRADLFLSLHANSAADRSVGGIETFCLTPAGGTSSNASKPESRRYAGNSYDNQNILLAYETQKGMLAETGATDRGVKRARFQVLRDARCPAVLIEIGFLSNTTDEKNLGSAAYLDRLAQGIVDGILRYRAAMGR